MIINASPNFFLALFGIAYAVKEFGWGSLLSFPYIILVIWLLFVAILVSVLRWHEDKEETVEDKLDILIKEIRQDRNERKRKTK